MHPLIILFALVLTSSALQAQKVENIFGSWEMVEASRDRDERSGDDIPGITMEVTALEVIIDGLEGRTGGWYSVRDGELILNEGREDEERFTIEKLSRKTFIWSFEPEDDSVRYTFT